MTKAVTSPDLLLARRAAVGHADAWQELIERYGARLYNVAIQFAGNSAEAEDLTQEIFLRIFQGLRTFRGEVPLISWALRLSRNLCIDHYRNLKRQRRWTMVPETILAELPGCGNPEAEFSRRQQLTAIYAALQQLPEDLAELVILRDLQGWSQEEVVGYLGIPLGTLKSRLHRARRQLAAVVWRRQAPGLGRTTVAKLPAAEAS